MRCVVFINRKRPVGQSEGVVAVCVIVSLRSGGCNQLLPCKVAAIDCFASGLKIGTFVGERQANDEIAVSVLLRANSR